MKVITELFGSKKFLAAIGSILLILSQDGLTADSTTKIAGIVIAYLFSQGIADAGKSAAEIRQEGPKEQQS